MLGQPIKLSVPRDSILELLSPFEAVAVFDIGIQTFRLNTVSYITSLEECRRFLKICIWKCVGSQLCLKGHVTTWALTACGIDRFGFFSAATDKMWRPLFKDITLSVDAGVQRKMSAWITTHFGGEMEKAVLPVPAISKPNQLLLRVEVCFSFIYIQIME